MPSNSSQAPKTLIQALKKIGPGMVLAASIVGSGELIATTTLGAEVGYVALWMVVFSCLIKPIIQSEMGRITIATSQTGLEFFNKVPPKNVIMWLWAVMTIITQLQIGAMYAGVSQVLHLVFPSVSVNVFIVFLIVITMALLLGGGYNRIEKIAMVKVGLFTILTFTAALLLLRQPQYFSWNKLSEGLKFNLPANGLQTAVAVFGIVGVGAAELFMYPYWCLEKGYAKYANETGETKAWIRVMNLDILASMLIYTVATVAFYLLGAGILNGMGLMPTAKDMIAVLSNIYTKTLGEWSLWIFYVGAIFTLYGTIFASTAANSRAFTDLLRLNGIFEKDNHAAKSKFQNTFIIILIIIPIAFYFIFQSPVQMVMAGGIAQSIMLPVIAWATVYLHHHYLPKPLKPTILTTILLWFASILITTLMLYYVWMKL
jgi:manganese transport protein